RHSAHLKQRAGTPRSQNAESNHETGVADEQPCAQFHGAWCPALAGPAQVRLKADTTYAVDRLGAPLAEQFVLEARKRRSHDVAMVNIWPHDTDRFRPQVMDALDVVRREGRRVCTQ